VIVLSSPEAFHDGSRGVTLRITDGARFDQRVSYVLAGPRPGEGHERDEPVPSEPHETGGEHR